MKSILLLCIVMLVAGCSSGDKARTSTEDVQTRCLNGVEYYLFRESNGNAGYGYMAPKFNRDGNVEQCNQ